MKSKDHPLYLPRDPVNKQAKMVVSQSPENSQPLASYARQERFVKVTIDGERMRPPPRGILDKRRLQFGDLKICGYGYTITNGNNTFRGGRYAGRSFKHRWYVYCVKCGKETRNPQIMTTEREKKGAYLCRE